MRGVSIAWSKFICAACRNNPSFGEQIVLQGQQMALDLNALAVYAKVVELGSFTAAAEALKLSKSMVSRQISELENELLVRLLNRTTRKLSLTEAWTVGFERALRNVAEAADGV